MNGTILVSGLFRNNDSLPDNESDFSNKIYVILDFTIFSKSQEITEIYKKQASKLMICEHI